MKNLSKLIFVLFTLILLSNCKERISYTGKIYDKEINLTNLFNEKDVLKNLGKPNYIDPIEKKYYYFSEKKQTKNFFQNEITSSKMIVFLFNKNNEIISIDQFNLEDIQNIKYIEDKTSNQLINKGLIEKIFGGVGNNLPQTNE